MPTPHSSHGAFRRPLHALPILVVALLALSPLGVTATDWPTYHGDNARQGDDTSDPGLSSPVATWTSTRLDGATYAAPLVVGSQVVVATENNTVYSLDSSDGAVEWSTHLGTPRTTAITCGDINPQGITSTPVIDGGNVYVVANIQTGSSSFYFDLVSLSLSTGAVNWQTNIDPPDNSNPSGITWSDEALTMEDRGALLVTDGRVFVPMGGNDGDCGEYHGYVVGYPETGPGTGSLTWWASSEVVSGDSQGADWSAGGLSEDAAGYIYASTGNSNQESASDTYDYSDGVVKLNPNTLAPGAPVDYFAPSNWYQLNAGDADLGSSAPLQLPNDRIFIVGKGGTGYLLNSTDLGHIGGQLAEHQVCHATSDAAFGSLAYADGTVFVGCSDGMAAVQIASSNDDFSTLWYNTSDVANHPPIVAGGLVWSVSAGGNQLLGFSTATGELEQTLSISGSTHFTTPAAANGQLYLAGGDYVNAFASVAPAPVNGVTLDGYGGVHHFGSVAAPTGNGPYWPGWTIATGVAVCPAHTGGYVLDGFGGVHPFGSAPTLPASAYWPGWDIANGIVVTSDCAGGYVLDGFGGVHPFGDAPPVTITGYWPNWDIAVAIVLRPDNRSGWVMDGFGGLHPFAAAGTAMPAVPTNGPYWPGWDIATGVTLDGAGGGYVLDGFGGVHPFGDAPPVTATAYWPNWDIAVAISEYSSSPPSGYVLDGFGGLHTFGGAPYAAAPAYLPGQDVFRALGVTT
jgi:outer membrane protein assembly factor BamB